MEVRPGVYSYDVDWEVEEPLTVQIVENDEATILFGGGTEDAAEGIIEVAQDHDIDILLVEHGDFDHYGGAPDILASLEDVELAVPAGDASFLEEADIEIDYYLESGENVWEIETIATPGHTPDNMSYLYEDVLIAGDTVVGKDSLFAASNDWSGALAVITSDYNANDEQARDSVASLLSFEFDAVLVSHGKNVDEGGYKEIETLVADISRRWQ